MGARVGLGEASGNRLAQEEGEGEECNKLENMLGNILLDIHLDMLVGGEERAEGEEEEEVAVCSS